MFSEQGKAQVKKEMQACRALAGPAENAHQLLAAARAAARDRVVVKRHPHHSPLAEDASFEVHGDRFRLLFRSGRELLFSPVIEQGPRRIWQALIEDAPDPAKTF